MFKNLQKEEKRKAGDTSVKILNIFQKEKAMPSMDHCSVLQQLVDCIKKDSVNKAVALLASTKKTKNPVAIPYTSDAVEADFSAVHQCFVSERISDNELAALIAMALMKINPKSIVKYLADSNYEAPDLARTIYLGTYFSTLRSLQEFSSAGIKKYIISSCGDTRTCQKCAKHNGKTHFVNKAIIGKTAPPFCECCRCTIIADL